MLQRNQSQEEVINTVKGPVEVIACPGSGKTTTLLERIHHLLELGVDGRRILMVTFSKKAAEEMKSRFVAKFGSDNQVTFCTLHALCFRILIDEGYYSGNDVISSDQAFRFVYQELSEKYHIPDAAEMVKNVLDEISKVKNSELDINTYSAECCDVHIFANVYESYQNMLLENHLVDFDSMLLEVLSLFHKNHTLLKKYQSMFSYIQCDEYQDTNEIQKQLLYLLAAGHRNLCVVGDDDQSIYGFRGAQPGIMMDFQKDFPDCRTIFLDRNYRSGQNIVRVAGALISFNTRRFQKSFISDRGEKGVSGAFYYKQFDGREKEMSYLLSRIQALHAKGIAYHDIAVLVRTNLLAEKPMIYMEKQGIPFHSVEPLESMYNKWIFRLIQTYFRLASGDGDESDVYTALTRPNKYLKMSYFRGCSYNEAEIVRRMGYIDETWKYTKTKESIHRMFSAFAPYSLSLDNSPLKLIAGMNHIGIKDEIVSRAKTKNELPDNELFLYQAMVDEAKEFQTIGEWFEHAKLDIRTKKRIEQESRNRDGVDVLTAHQSKGLEWPYVFVIDVNKNTFPHQKNNFTLEEKEEERRLLYVAMTRAEDGLEVLSSEQPSPFMVSLLSKINQKKTEKMLKERPSVGSKMDHKKYGIGIVKDCDGEVICVQFADKSREFRYPDAIIHHFLTPVKP